MQSLTICGLTPNVSHDGSVRHVLGCCARPASLHRTDAHLTGATPAGDRRFRPQLLRLAIRPDELKIYPCSLIAGTELLRPLSRLGTTRLSEADLVDLLADVKPAILPPRANRLFRRHPGAPHPGRRR